MKILVKPPSIRLNSSISSAIWLLIVTAAAFNNLHSSSALTHLSSSIHPHNNIIMSTTSLCATPSIQWGIIGLGDVCTLKSGPAFYKSTGSKLIAVMRRTPGAAKQWVADNREVVQQYNNHHEDDGEGVELRGYESIQEMIAENIDELDAIYVATPPGVHLENVRQIISALEDYSTSSSGRNNNKPPRLKAIYMEKPCGRSAWETRVMIDELHHRNIQFFPAYVSRAHERTQVLLNLLLSSTENKSSIIGEQVTKVQYTQRGSSFARGLDGEGIPWRLQAEYSGGGLVMDMGCHVLDRMDYLFGPIVDVTSTVLRKGSSSGGSNVKDESYQLVEDYVSMKGRIGPCDWAVISSEGAIVECLWDFAPPNNEKKKNEQDELIITGTKGSLRMAGMGAGLPIEVLDVDGNVIETIEFEAPMHAAQPLIQSIVNELRDDKVVYDEQQQEHCLDRSPARAENAVRTSEVLDAILNSYYGGRHDEFWTRPESWPGLK